METQKEGHIFPLSAFSITHFLNLVRTMEMILDFCHCEQTLLADTQKEGALL